MRSYLDTDLLQKLCRTFEDYRHKVGVKDPIFTGHHYETAVLAAYKMRHYDCGISLARDGIWLGFIFSLFGFFPIINVWLKRKGRGASWNAPSNLEQLVRGKRIIVFDNDTVTGRTLKRAVRELKKCKPESIDLLLVFRHTIMRRGSYEKLSHFFSGRVHISEDENSNLIALDTQCMIRDDFRKVMSLENFPRQPRLQHKAILRLEEILEREEPRGGSNE